MNLNFINFLLREIVDGVTLTGTTENTGVLKIPQNKAFYIRFDVPDISKNQLNQNMLIRLKSKELTNVAEPCNDDYLQVFGYFETYKTNLTGRWFVCLKE